MQSKTLTKFYKELQAWLDEGMPDEAVFFRSFGICYNLTNWMNQMNWANKAAFDLEHDRAQKELISSFIKAGLDSRFPFNLRGAQGYAEEYSTRWENKGRKHWVFAHSRTVQ